MANKMLIDAGHPEETRVVVVRGNRVEEFDFEAANRKQLRGNIYLAKVTRVEPSLQAAFVEYGGNRHGFLAFSEIHPDYYQIPVADREALLAAEAADRQRDDSDGEEKPKRRRRSRAARNEATDSVASDKVEADASDEATEGDEEAVKAADETDGEAVSARSADEDVSDEEDDEASSSSEETDEDEEEAPVRSRGRGRGRRRQRQNDDDDDADNDIDAVESVGAEDAMEEVPERIIPLRKQYKIQEVIKRRQIILVQVVKEERGNKGAALTTYLSLAGRYSVLMPNTARGGGISRKITQPTDRKRLKKIASELDVPEGMGVILRTAGASRTKAEIKRDFEYLMRLWENVRELTLKSSAPSLVYEEGSLVKRSIRDLYNKDINEVLVAGEEGYREAKDFMRMLMPSHAKNVQPYRDPSPLFIRYGVEPQLDAMFSPQVTLKSGGYIVINQTEALVSIDVNSGKSTREHNIEDTALQTNLEAAEEVTRQLRLRDLAGLIVIDFIDMEESKNNRSVERKLKDCLKNDRARIQVGRISHFGLLEMSRQRIRTGVLESSTTPCPHCQGTGMIRSVESVALHVLRSVEDNLLKGASHNLIIRTTTQVALYILNQKRSNLVDLETRFAIDVEVHADDMVNGQLYVLERGAPVDRDRVPMPVPAIVQPDTIDIIDEDTEQPDIEEFAQQEDDNDGRRRRRRRKRRRNGSDNQQDDGESRQASAEADDADSDGDDDQPQEARSGEEDGDDEPRRKRRRGRRGGRRGRRNGDEAQAEGGAENDGETNGDNREAATSDEQQDDQAGSDTAVAAESGNDTEAVEVAPQDDAQTDELTAVDGVAESDASGDSPADETAQQDGVATPAQADAAEESPAAAEAETIVVDTPTSEQPVASEADAEEEAPARKAPAEPVVTSETSGDDTKEDKPKRGGWWQRGRSFF
ncbi:ribonuclease E [Stappia aggregata IAM 12614]|uniref:Ribonuclease E n=1 Tax=Roseibium aggregatum (strain ATCC 25650 / DSM 13394 / JCM 20685 / NBRC 16684 / NCIMB 2208 / IAM 12614 / B1) TaxID=384765 RepID=A0NTB9_ROSAI|nr:ribonuclease E/G [Roseibium aggregatum]EAV44201.1 ribonuclease E [Stappia aggregata IAM 12614] [Roseibium aggregatum IAM 12614]